MDLREYKDIHRLNRRNFLKVAAGSGLAAGSLASLAGCGTPDSVEQSTLVPHDPLEDASSLEGSTLTLPDGLKAEDFIVHNTSPWNLEMPRSGFGTSAITPNHRLYVRSNLPLPPAAIVENRDAWTLAVSGVKRPQELRLNQLKDLGFTTVAAVIQCSGNGRRWFEHQPSGSPWGIGAAGNIVWTGVSIRSLVESLGGLESETAFLTATGGEPIPEGLEERQVVVERSIPVEKGLNDALLAWEMNGEPIPLIYGGPLRLIVPGYYGVNQVKYVKRLAFTQEESDSKIQQTSYRFRPIGEKGSSSQPSLWAMNVKSWITSPLEDKLIHPGKVRVVGVAFAGEQPIDRVEITTDQGSSWQNAEFTGLDLGPFAWRQFSAALDVKPGTLLIASRTTDAAGNTQPELRVENHRGYANNSWRDHAITVRVQI